jgi:diaminohydroxyphosphoribosylaminopyrimidine deaminase/5-amino-6-(5-phosphoribosylamino)uracil reductase
VTLKAALTLDCQAAAADGTSQWITSPEARADGHRLRAEADAVAVGAGTLAADDPLLTVRLLGYDGPQPRPVVVAGRRPLPPGARLWERRPLVLSAVPVDGPGEVVVVPGPGGVDLAAGLAALGERGLLDLLVEGGPTLAGALVRAGLVDRGVFYLGARLAAGVGLPGLAGPFATLAAAREIEIVSAGPVGPDLRVEFVVKEH